MNIIITFFLFYIYRWTGISAGNTFQDLPQLGETVDNTK